MNSIAKIWTIMKAVWVFYLANRELIEKHIAWLKAEIAERKAEQAIIASDNANQKLSELKQQEENTK